MPNESKVSNKGASNLLGFFSTPNVSVIKYTTISITEIMNINEENLKLGQRKLFKNPQKPFPCPSELSSLEKCTG